MKESHELLALAEQSAGIGIWDTDLATDMVRATPTFFHLMGLPVSAEPIANDIVRAVRHPDDAARVREGFRDSPGARRSIPTRSNIRIIRPSDGELRWIFGRGRTVRDDDGRPVRYSGVDIDVTERKRAEEHVRLLMAELNHRANNLLTVVQALAHQTADSADAEGLRPAPDAAHHRPRGLQQPADLGQVAGRGAHDPGALAARAVCRRSRPRASW